MSTESTKTVRGRISNKHGTEKFWILSVYKSESNLADWNKHTNPFIPLPGELIIYDPDTPDGDYRFKFGDPEDREGGRRNVVDLPFVDETIRKELEKLVNWINKPQIIESLTREKLLEYRESGELGPGAWYRITDYEFVPNGEDLTSAGYRFDIIVQATSKNTLSEIAKAEKHRTGEILEEFIQDETYVKEGLIDIAFYELIDDDAHDFAEGYKHTDKFIGYGYMENEQGYVVPVLYKTDTQVRDEGEQDYRFPDYDDPFYFVGRRDVDGDTYDVWRKISYGSEDMEWDGSRRHYAYTNIITTDDYYEPTRIDETNLSAWDIRYCIDNDTNRFEWASPNGKGVIYWLKDEYNNECSYDFKNLIYIKDNEYYATFSDNEEKLDHTLFGKVRGCKISAAANEIYELPRNIVMVGVDNKLNNIAFQPGCKNLFVELPDGGENITFCSELQNKEIVVSDDEQGTRDLVYRSGTITEIYLD